MSEYLAIGQESGKVFIEQSEAAIADVLANERPVAYYKIEVDPDSLEPSLSQRVTLGTGPRTVAKVVETVSLEAGGAQVGSTEVARDA